MAEFPESFIFPPTLRFFAIDAPPAVTTEPSLRVLDSVASLIFICLSNSAFSENRAVPFTFISPRRLVVLYTVRFSPTFRFFFIPAPPFTVRAPLSGFVDCRVDSITPVWATRLFTAALFAVRWSVVRLVTVRVLVLARLTSPKKLIFPSGVILIRVWLLVFRFKGESSTVPRKPPLIPMYLFPYTDQVFPLEASVELLSEEVPP